MMTEDPSQMDPRRIDTLLAIMKALRTPGTGCPWDLEQSFETIAPYTIEEAYEVSEAISGGDRDELREELGDLLLQPVYHAQIAAEEGCFTFADVVEAVCTKMIRRHPHVFGDETARNAKLAKGFWEDIKGREKKAQMAGPAGVLDGVPLALPALSRAIKLQNKAAKVGFDWPSVESVFDKLKEEIEELRSAPENGRAEEIGDLLFVVANLARHYNVDAEEALRNANRKFEARFRFIEQKLEETGKSPAQSNLDEMENLWTLAKINGL
jgi:nucleoside triphosphate diphosphatase